MEQEGLAGEEKGISVIRMLICIVLGWWMAAIFIDDVMGAAMFDDVIICLHCCFMGKSVGGSGG